MINGLGTKSKHYFSCGDTEVDIQTTMKHKNTPIPDTQSNGSSETAGTSASRTDASVIDEERFETRREIRRDLIGLELTRFCC